jgi:hypothetical protein
MGKAARRKVVKRQNSSRTVNMRTRRAATQRVGKTKKISQSPSITPGIPEAELTVESSNLKKCELYMLNEAEFVRTFGWWGFH